MRSINTTPASRRATPRFARRLALPLLALTCGATVASANIFEVADPIDTNFTTAANWEGGLPNFGAMATTDSITVRYENISSGAPALINTSVTGFGFLTSAQLRHLGGTPSRGSPAAIRSAGRISILPTQTSHKPLSP